MYVWSKIKLFLDLNYDDFIYKNWICQSPDDVKWLENSEISLYYYMVLK